MSRGFLLRLNSRTQKSITLTWVVLFILSLLLQYTQFAAPKSALATVGGSTFELDGNIAHSTSHDWDQVYNDFQNGTSTSGADNIQFITDQVNSLTDDIFTGGGSKDQALLQGGPWLWTTSKPQPKDDIVHAFAAAYQVGGDTIAYFGLDKYEVDGDNQVGFWFFKNSIGKTNTSSQGGFKFSGEHAVGDILVLSDYTNGGSVPNFTVYKWVGSGGSAGSLDLVANTGECDGTNQTGCGKTNAAGFTSSAWPYQNRDVDAQVYPPGGLFEGGLNLTELGLDTGCFTSFLAETRSSQSVTATLSDFALGNFSFCVTPNMSTSVSDSSITISGSVTDTATLTGTKGTPTGTVKFFVCGPSGSNPDCTSGGDPVGATMTLSGGQATSDAFTPPSPGHYCFRAEYTPATGSHYLPESHTNLTTECFNVVKKQPAISTTASAAVQIGQTINDVAHLSGGLNPTGSITFNLYGPNDTNCSGSVAYTNTKTVNGNGDYTSANYTTTAAGTFRWIASYSGDTNNSPVSGSCNDADENVVIGKLQPAISTTASGDVTIDGSVHDVAHLSGATANAGGTITFKLYGPDDATCANAAVFTTTAAVSGNGNYTSASFVPTAVGAYRWIASYGGDANNLPVSGSCNDENESVVVNKANPTITTSLVGGGQSGASITVSLGTAVHDTATLHDASTNAGGTVTYTVYSDDTCDTFFAAAGTKTVVNGVVPNSNAITFNHAGVFYWQATYSGDPNNNGATSSCNSEIVTVEQNIPQISTTASGNVTVGGSISDVAHLSGTFNGTGTITFKLYGPDDANCTGDPIHTSTATVNGDGDYTSGNFTTGAAGTYRWVASYSGDGDNAAVSGACNDENESAVVSPAKPAISTSASGTVTVGGSISDIAHLTGGFNPTGTITFHLYGPDDATCATSIFTATATVSGNGDYSSGNFTTSAAGTYRWIASYGGDANNDPISGACTDANEAVVVTKASPAISTTASDPVTVGGTISDVAHLSGTFNGTGTITFHLYGPDDATCADSIFSSTATVNGNGNYNSGDFTTLAAGTYRWIASYSGDANNGPVSGACNDANEAVVVSPAKPAISTTATEGSIIGGKIKDVAHLSGGFNPTGSVTFNLYGPGDDLCAKSAIFTDEVTVNGNGNYTSAEFTVQAAGVYQWIASYSGDANNDPVSGSCGDAGEQTTVTKNAPSISTMLHSGDISGAKISVLHGSSVTDQATLTGASSDAGGTVTYTVFTDDACQNAFADAGTKDVTNGSVPASDAVAFPDTGTFYWQAHYSGDANNAPATSVCTDEVVTVTAPSIHAEKTINGSHTSIANPGDTVEWTITVVNKGDGDATGIQVSDDISAILAHGTFVSADNGGSLNGSVVSWPAFDLPAGSDPKVLHFTVHLNVDGWPVGTTELPNTVVVIGEGSNCPAGEGDADCATNTTVNQPELTIVKDVSGNTGGTDPILGVPSAKVGDTLLYTLTWTLTSGPVHNAVIVDHLPTGMTAPTNISNGGVYDAVANTITWHLGTIEGPDATGTVTYNVKIKAADAALAQPLRNVATIKSDETPEDSDDAVVAVQGEVKQSTPTPRVTPPNTSTGDAPSGDPGNTGLNLTLILLTLGAVTLVVGFLTPAPATVRRRNRRG